MNYIQVNPFSAVQKQLHMQIRLNRYTPRLFVLGCLSVLLAGGLASAAPPELASLRCEYRTEPCGLDVAQPRLSWLNTATARGARQTAYQVLVASAPELLAKDTGDLWDSGKTATDQSIAVRYAGHPFSSETQYFWKVRIWDQSGLSSAWSLPASFLTGKMQPADWRGQWIGPAVVKPAPPANTHGKVAAKNAAAPTVAKPVRQHGAIYLRKEFALAKPAVRAVLSFSGLGFSEVAIDGVKVGEYVIGPGFTDYEHRVQYLTFAVAKYFTVPGRKRLDVTLVDGWYALKKDPWVHKFEQQPYVDRPKLLLDLRLIHADGTETLIRSDMSWRWSTGEITQSWIAQEDLDL